MRVLFYDLKGVVVNGNHDFGTDELDRFERVLWPHGEIIADGQNGQVNALLADELHVVKESRIASVIDLFALDGQQKTGRVAAVAAVGERRPVVRDGQLDAPEGKVVTAANVQRVGFDPLVLAVSGDFKVGDDRRPGAFGDGHRVAQVVAVGVGDQNVIRAYLAGRDCGLRVAGEKRIGQQRCPAPLDTETSVSIPGYFHSPKLPSSLAKE